MAGVNSVDALPDLFSMIVRTVSVETEAISLGAEMRLTTGSVSTKVVTGTSEIVTMVASETTTTGIDFTVVEV